MFARPSTSARQSFSKNSKLEKSSRSFSKDAGVTKRRHEPRLRRPTTATTSSSDKSPLMPGPVSSIVTLVVGAEQRIFAAHATVLSHSPWFATVLQLQHVDTAVTQRVSLPDEEPEIFSSVLEYLYKGDYYPKLIHNKRRNSWEIESLGEDTTNGIVSTTYHHTPEGELLKDTVIYCAAEKYGLDELKRIALRKQGLQSGIQCSTILASARYAYAHTPDTDSKLRAHYLALIIRSRSTFKRSGTMQLEMFSGGTQLFFDLFVALCNHVDDMSTAQGTPKSSRFI